MDANTKITSLPISVDALDPLLLALDGRTLIEASAGTGKTYTLSLLYLRLLLGLGQVPGSRPLSVNEILVVTFTNAATDELRYKIRETIHTFRMACLRGYHHDTLYQDLLDRIEEPQLAANVLAAAEQQMDDAAIYTIHGFCQRILMTHALESNMLFEHQVSHHMQMVYRQSAQDIWRRFFNPLPKVIAKEIKGIWPSPDALMRAVMPYLKQHEQSACGVSKVFSSEQIIRCFTERKEAIEELKRAWCAARQEIECRIQASGVNKRSYNKKNLPKWLQAVDDWAYAPTDTLLLPNALQHFSLCVLLAKSHSDPPKHPVFREIESQLFHISSLGDAILPSLITEFTQTILYEKQRRAEIEPDDLLQLLKKALQAESEHDLAHTLSRTYPVALIDEFQDTDATQYAIFDHIYQNKRETGLLLIGDPKQSIYQFRGADIFVYMQAKKQVDRVCNMGTNWRSCSALVEGTNALFSQVNVPFKFEQIPFEPVQSAPANTHLRLECEGECLDAFQYYCIANALTNEEEFLQESAQFTAKYLHRLLFCSTTFLVQEKEKRVLRSADVAILVRNRKEADRISTALNRVGIQSVFLSNRSSIFDSEEAKELLWILKAILEPQRISLIHTALATRFFGVDMTVLDGLQKHPQRLEEYIESFVEYRYYWTRFGVMAMIQYIMKMRCIPENVLAMAGGERMLTNIMHLAELLQTVAEEMDQPHAVVNWLAKQIFDGVPDQDAAILRLESDDNVVKIITIHKSKGLEYPVVFIPFLSVYKKATEGEYHDRVTYERKYVNKSDPVALRLLDEERLAEDVRLCYVAITRAIYLCCIGLGEWQNDNLPWFESGLGSLLATEEMVIGTCSFSDALSQLTVLKEVTEKALTLTLPQKKDAIPQDKRSLFVQHFQRKLRQNWAISSYSSWNDHSATDALDTLTEALLPEFDVDAMVDLNDVHQHGIRCQLSIHDLPRGAKVGTLLHSLLESLDFSTSLPQAVFTPMKQRLNLSEEWEPVLRDWLSDLLSVQLSEDGLSLNRLLPDQKHAEIDFFLPIRSTFSAKEYHQIVQAFDPLSAHCAPLSFERVSGMLKGFIDLVFEWQGKFYIVDYKSNALGSHYAAYNQAFLVEAMKTHRYDIQYQLYTLALHRYLQQRLPQYQYECHFGGVYYLFLRGMTTTLPGNGIFYCKPQAELIHSLDALFNGSLLS